MPRAGTDGAPVAGRYGAPVAPRVGMDGMLRAGEEEFTDREEELDIGLEKEGEAVPRRGHTRGGRAAMRGNRAVGGCGGAIGL